MDNREPMLISVPRFADSRGSFTKPFSASIEGAPAMTIDEIYWSISHRGVIRGMHFQTQPHGIAKLVWVSRGSILDYLVDLREGPSYGELHRFDLSVTSPDVLFVPVGFGHGFQSLEDDTTVYYAVDGAFSPQHDKGVAWDSIGADWPLEHPEVSDRDRSHPTLHDFSDRFTS